MNDHPNLVALLRGELAGADVADAGDHLDSCDECRQQLADTAVGHALLTGTTRTLSRPARVEVPRVPPLKFPPSAPRGRVRLRRLGLVAAAAALVAGTVVLSQWVDGPPSPRASVAAPGRIAELEPVEGNGSGRVVMGTDSPDRVRMTVETSGLPKIGEGQFFEVWLLNPKTQKMLALGVLDPGGQASFEVPDSLMGRYQVVDISLERDNGDPDHSITSVLRATYA